MTATSHETREECIEAEDWIGPDAPDDAIGDAEPAADNMYIEEVTCPTCGREYEYVFEMRGLYDPEDDQYVWRP